MVEPHHVMEVMSAAGSGTDIGIPEDHQLLKEAIGKDKKDDPDGTALPLSILEFEAGL